MSREDFYADRILYELRASPKAISSRDLARRARTGVERTRRTLTFLFDNGLVAELTYDRWIARPPK